MRVFVLDEDEDEKNDVERVLVLLEGWLIKNPGHKVIILNNPISPK